MRASNAMHQLRWAASGWGGGAAPGGATSGGRRGARSPSHTHAAPTAGMGVLGREGVGARVEAEVLEVAVGRE